MLVHTLAHFTLHPGENRQDFYDLMAENWAKLSAAPTTWYAILPSPTYEVAADHAISMIYAAARAALVGVRGYVKAGNSAPVEFESEPSLQDLLNAVRLRIGRMVPNSILARFSPPRRIPLLPRPPRR